MSKFAPYMQSVHEDGYEWKNCIDEVWTPCLGIKQGSNGKNRRQYDVMEKVRLYEKFANLSQHRSSIDKQMEDIMAFANDYGMLGTAPVKAVDGVKCESLQTWRYEASRMNQAVVVWHAIQNNDQPLLKQLIDWPCSNQVCYCTTERLLDGDPNYKPVDDGIPIGYGLGERSYVLIEGNDAEYTEVIAEGEEEAMDAFSVGGVIKPAMVLLARWTAEALGRGCLAATVSFHYDGAPGYQPNYKLHFGATNLLSAIWLQFASVLENGMKPHCESCGKLLQNFQRNTKRFCSEACRCKEKRKRLNG